MKLFGTGGVVAAAVFALTGFAASAQECMVASYIKIDKDRIIR